MPPTPSPTGPASTASGQFYQDATLSNLQDWLIKIADNTTAMRESMQRGESRGDRERQQSREREDPPWARRLGDRIERGLGTAVSSALNQARSLAARGMSGTLEQAQQDYAMQQLGRQFAAVMLPITQAFTYLAGQIERRMAAMGGSEQNRMMGALAGGGIGYQLGGVPGAILGATAGAGVMGNGVSAWGGPIGMLSGGAAGFRAGGLPGAVIGAGAGSFVGGGGTNVYDASRARGNSQVTSGAIAGSTTFGMRGLIPELLELTGVMRSTRELAARKPDGMAAAAGAKPGDARRDITPFSAEMTDLGQQYFRFQESMIRATAGAGFEDAGPLKPLMDLLLDIYDVLGKILIKSGGEPPTPRSAETTRG